MNNIEYWFWICSTRGIYQNDIKKMMNYFESPEEIYNEGQFLLSERHLLSEEQIYNLFERKKNEQFHIEYESMRKNGIRFIPLYSPDYPSRLKILPDAPYAIYVKGNTPKEEIPTIGMVGARACSEYGRIMTEKFTKALVMENCQTVSGLAVGIDGVCAKTTLKSGGNTFAVLGSGIDVIYPSENIDLYYEIIMKGGGIITEYPIGTKPLAWQFPHRNRIISALSDVLLVFEARKKSGTLSTAQYALAQGKDVFSLPGRINDKLSEGCNRLIFDGAGILLSPEELINSLFPKKNTVTITNDTVTNKKIDLAMEINEGISGNVNKKVRAVYNCLSFEPKMIDEINDITGLPIQEISYIIMELELKGLIMEVSKDYYVKAE